MSYKRSFTPQKNNFNKPKRVKLDIRDASRSAVNQNRDNSPRGNGGNKWDKLQQQRRNLPVFSARKKLLQELQRNATVVIIGETGSGKTTQIPQYILETRMDFGGVIAVTQPRRIAAITVAERVSEEMNVKLGEKVGYCVRFDDMTSYLTKLKYMTDGMLLREAMLDPDLTKYSVVVLDEAHERTVQTDVLFSVVKSAQAKRKKEGKRTLKVIVMSATMDVDRFSKYFNNAPVLYLEGRQYSVQVMYSKEPQPDYLFSVLVTVFQIHQETKEPGDILVFLTGQEEIESVTRNLRSISKSLPQGTKPLRVLPLYAALPAQQQLHVFQPSQNGVRKVIVATNVAETSVTISGIRFVIDSGLVKAKVYSPQTGLETLRVRNISKAQAWQRSGRAGRESSGVCYRLYTENAFNGYSDCPVPEIQRCNLSLMVLQLLTLGIRDVMKFDFLDRPSPAAVAAASNELSSLGAINVDDREGLQLTELGRKMSAFPVDPKYARIIIASEELHCTQEILSIVSMMSIDSVDYTPPNKKDEALSARRKFLSSDGDPLYLLNVFKAYKNVKNNKPQWCREHFLHNRQLGTAMEIYTQLLDICLHQKMSVKAADDIGSIRMCLVKGLFLNAAVYHKGNEYHTVPSRTVVSIHPASCLFGCRPPCIVFSELVRTSRNYVRGVCSIENAWLEDVRQHIPRPIYRVKKAEQKTG